MRRLCGVIAALAAAAAGAAAPPSGIEIWRCTSREGAETRELEFDHVSRRIVMRVGDAAREGRFTIDSAHLVAVFAESGGDGVEELTFGLASGRIFTKLRRADGQAQPSYAGHCRRLSEST